MVLWLLVFGFWSLVFGLWFLVFGFVLCAFGFRFQSKISNLRSQIIHKVDQEVAQTEVCGPFNSSS